MQIFLYICAIISVVAIGWELEQTYLIEVLDRRAQERQKNFVRQYHYLLSTISVSMYVIIQVHTIGDRQYLASLFTTFLVLTIEALSIRTNNKIINILKGA
jgi:hypothetical protein